MVEIAHQFCLSLRMQFGFVNYKDQVISFSYNKSDSDVYIVQCFHWLFIHVFASSTFSFSMEEYGRQLSHASAIDQDILESKIVEYIADQIEDPSR